jgi:hypothetical protein
MMLAITVVGLLALMILGTFGAPRLLLGPELSKDQGLELAVMEISICVFYLTGAFFTLGREALELSVMMDAEGSISQGWQVYLAQESTASFVAFVILLLLAAMRTFECRKVLKKSLTGR